MIAASQVVDTARSFVGVPFRHQGRALPTPLSKGGLDCVGVVAKTAHTLGISEFDWTNYQRRATWSKEFEAVFEGNMRRVQRDQIVPGIAVIFKQEQLACHCGIIGNGRNGLTLIHAYLIRRKVVEERFEGEWSDPRTFLAAFAYHGVNYG